jgi:hypothetical protein
MARAVNRSRWGLASSVAWRNMPGRAGERDGVQAAGLSADPLPGPSGGVLGDRVRSRSLAGPARALGPRSPSGTSPGTASFPSQTLRRDARRAPAGKPEFWLACSRQQHVTRQSGSPRARLHSRARGPFPRVSGVPAGDTRGLHDIASTPALSRQCGKRTADEGYAKLPRR